MSGQFISGTQTYPMDVMLKINKFVDLFSCSSIFSLFYRNKPIEPRSLELKSFLPYTVKKKGECNYINKCRLLSVSKRTCTCNRMILNPRSLLRPWILRIMEIQLLLQPAKVIGISTFTLSTPPWSAQPALAVHHLHCSVWNVLSSPWT